MTIQLITEEIYRELLAIQENFPALTYQNRGYDEIDMSSLSQEEISAHKRVSEILTIAIKDFVRFQNFKIRKNGEVTLRFQYRWGPTFTGVGYLSVRELYHGFDGDFTDYLGQDWNQLSKGS